jgi:hypothetical protein
MGICFFTLFPHPALSPVCGGEGKGEGAKLEKVIFNLSRRKEKR